MSVLDAVARARLDGLAAQDLFKVERSISSPQGARINLDGRPYVNLCANNYLGLARDLRLVEAAKAALDTHGYGMASVRFICGTHDLHRELESALATYLGKEDCILFSSGFDANTGLFETLLGEDDAVVSDALNMPQSSTASGFARRRAISTRTGIWICSKRSFAPPAQQA